MGSIRNAFFSAHSVMFLFNGVDMVLSTLIYSLMIRKTMLGLTIYKRSCFTRCILLCWRRFCISRRTDIAHYYGARRIHYAWNYGRIQLWLATIYVILAINLAGIFCEHCLAYIECVSCLTSLDRSLGLGDYIVYNNQGRVLASWFASFKGKLRPCLPTRVQHASISD